MPKEPPTSPFAPDLAEVRAWLGRMMAALRFVEVVTAIVALVGRMRDINAELTKQLAHLRRKGKRIFDEKLRPDCGIQRDVDCIERILDAATR
jgi:hypothetical protein